MPSLALSLAAAVRGPHGHDVGRRPVGVTSPERVWDGRRAFILGGIGTDGSDRDGSRVIKRWILIDSRSNRGMSNQASN